MSNDLDLGALSIDTRAALEAIERTQSGIDGLSTSLEQAGEHGGEAMSQLASAAQRANEGFDALSTIFGLNQWAEFGEKIAHIGEKLIEATIEAERQQHAIEALGDSYGSVVRATNDTVEATDAFRVQQQLAQAEIDITGDQLAALLGRAREYALATGTETPAAVERLTSALISGSSRGLHQFGIEIAQGSDRATALDGALRQLSEHMAQNDPPARTLGEDLQHIRRGFSDSLGEMASWITEATGLRDVIHEISSAFDEQANATEHATQQVEEGVTRMLSAIATARQQLQTASNAPSTNSALDVQVMGGDSATRELYGQLGQVLGRTVRTTDLTSQELTQLQASIEVMSGSARDFSDADRANAQEMQRATIEHALYRVAEEHARHAQDERTQALHADVEQMRQQAAQRRLHREAVTEARREGIQVDEGGGGGGRRGGTAADHALDQQILQRTKLIELDQRALDLQAQESARYAQQAEDAERAREAQVEAERAVTRSIQEHQKALQELQRENSLSAQTSIAFQHHAELTQTTAQGMAGLVEGAYNTMTGALKAHIGALLQGKENIGQALKGILQEVLLNLATESLVKAIFQGAEGVAALVTPGRQAEAAGHFIAAAEYGAVAAIGGLGYAAVSAIPSGSSSTAGSTAQTYAGASPGGSGSGNGQQNITINVNGTLVDREGFSNAVYGAMRDLNQRGMTPQSRR